jgi:hypothetical protein
VPGLYCQPVNDKKYSGRENHEQQPFSFYLFGTFTGHQMSPLLIISSSTKIVNPNSSAARIWYNL